MDFGDSSWRAQTYYLRHNEHKPPLPSREARYLSLPSPPPTVSIPLTTVAASVVNVLCLTSPPLCVCCVQSVLTRRSRRRDSCSGCCRWWPPARESADYDVTGVLVTSFPSGEDKQHMSDTGKPYCVFYKAESEVSEPGITRTNNFLTTINSQNTKHC